MDETQSPADHLVPGRECGACTVCCKTPKITELKKPAGVLCDDCTENVGCRIYESRPSVCRGWYCGWRRMPYLNDDWRPDRCGVVIDIVGGEGQGIPPGFAQVGLKFDIINSPRVLAWDPLLGFIRSEIERGRPVFLGVPAALGFERRKIFLNHLMAHAVASRDRMLMINGLVSTFQMGMRDAMKEKTTFDELSSSSSS